MEKHQQLVGAGSNRSHTLMQENRGEAETKKEGKIRHQVGSGMIPVLLDLRGLHVPSLVVAK